MKRILILMLLGAVLFAGAQIPAAAAYAGKKQTEENVVRKTTP